MFGVYVDYASPSALESSRDRDLLGLSANARRPVRFDATVQRDKLAFRNCLRALGELVWSDDHWFNDAWFTHILDPVVTVHDDRVFFEAFSQDQSVYGQVIVDRSVFDTHGEVVTGTTNIDFTAWLWGALGEMRSRRDTRLRIASEGLELKTTGAGGRFESRVDLPEEWVRGFVTVQSALAMPGTRLTVRPVDLLAALRTLKFQHAKMSPRALRYCFEPGESAHLVLEPWEQVIPLKGATHNYDQSKTIRTWGRRRLRLIESLLPYADEVTVYLKGRALPSAYVVRLGKIRFVLVLSGWTGNNWSRGSSFDLAIDDRVSDETVARVHTELVSAVKATDKQIAASLSLTEPEAHQSLARLCRQGRCLFDLEDRTYRHRELFDAPLDTEKLFPPNVQRDVAAALIKAGDVDIRSVESRQTERTQKLRTPDGSERRVIVFRDWHVSGRAGEEPEVSIVLNQGGRIIFGTCGCEHFREHLLNQGPCGHMIAVLKTSHDQRTDAATSIAAPERVSDSAEEDDL